MASFTSVKVLIWKIHKELQKLNTNEIKLPIKSNSEGWTDTFRKKNNDEHKGYANMRGGNLWGLNPSGWNDLGRVSHLVIKCQVVSPEWDNTHTDDIIWTELIVFMKYYEIYIYGYESEKEQVRNTYEGRKWEEREEGNVIIILKIKYIRINLYN